MPESLLERFATGRVDSPIIGYNKRPEFPMHLETVPAKEAWLTDYQNRCVNCGHTWVNREKPTYRKVHASRASLQQGQLSSVAPWDLEKHKRALDEIKIKECRNCGAHVDARIKTCTSCGASLA
jgi:Zn ribbon nucleic-acid-binding protein